MSRIKDWILWRQEIDSQDDPDMEVQGDWESPDETNPPAAKKLSADLTDEGQAKTP